MNTTMISDRAAVAPRRQARRGFDLGAVPPVPFHRTVQTELRKMVDTRGGRGLIIAIGAITALLMILIMIIQQALGEPAPFSLYFSTTTYSSLLLLPVLGMLLVTSEWSQRTAMITFALEPNRLKVLGAKYVAGVLAVLATVTIATAVAAAVTAIQAGVTGQTGLFDLTVAEFAGFVAGQLLSFTAGFAIASLIGQLAVAVVIYFFLELAGWNLLPLAGMIGWFEPIQPWINLGQASGRLIDGQLLSGAVEGATIAEAWGQLAVSALVWVVTPLIIGTVRFLKREAK